MQKKVLCFHDELFWGIDIALLKVELSVSSAKCFWKSMSMVRIVI